MPAPTPIDPITARALLAQEDFITDVATSLIIQCACDPEFTEELNCHMELLQCARELIVLHESENPADAYAKHCATQLKLWHLAELDRLTTTTDSQA